jgi:hypothetical protein
VGKTASSIEVVLVSVARNCCGDDRSLPQARLDGERGIEGETESVRACVCGRERGIEREGDGEGERERDRKRERQTERKTDANNT